MEGVMTEMTHGFLHRLEPLTICSYEVDVDDVVDLRTDADRNAAGLSLDELGCAWELNLANHTEPASWRIAKDFMAHGRAGILVPSFARGARADMYNIVLWTWGPDLPHRVNVFDPSGRLPKNQLSWD
jgi:RES domain-containing protein